jgi:hypothetical protein
MLSGKLDYVFSDKFKPNKIPKPTKVEKKTASTGFNSAAARF